MLFQGEAAVRWRPDLALGARPPRERDPAGAHAGKAGAEACFPRKPGAAARRSRAARCSGSRWPV